MARTMMDPLEDTQALRVEDLAEISGKAEEQDETGAPERVAETEETVPIEAELGDGAPRPFVPEDESSPSTSTDALVTEPMYSTDDEATESSEPGAFKRDQEAAADREPRLGNAPAPGQRPSDSGSTPSDIPTEADEDAHPDHTLRRRPS